MKIAFISDLHSNLEASISVLNDINSKGIENVYCLGDLVGYGPNPNEVVQLIRERNITSIMGNYDDAVAYDKTSCGCSYNPGRENRVGDDSLNWTITNLSNSNKQFLRSLPKALTLKIEELNILMVHGSPKNPLFEYLKPDMNNNDLKEALNNVSADVIVCGHTHKIMGKHLANKSILNPGSVGRTKDGKPLATYLILDVNDGVFSYEFVKLEYNVKKTIEKIFKSGLPIELAVVLALGSTFDMGNDDINFKLL